MCAPFIWVHWEYSLFSIKNVVRNSTPNFLTTVQILRYRRAFWSATSLCAPFLFCRYSWRIQGKALSIRLFVVYWAICICFCPCPQAKMLWNSWRWKVPLHDQVLVFKSSHFSYAQIIFFCDNWPPNIQLFLFHCLSYSHWTYVFLFTRVLPEESEALVLAKKYSYNFEDDIKVSPCA